MKNSQDANEVIVGEPPECKWKKPGMFFKQGISGEPVAKAAAENEADMQNELQRQALQADPSQICDDLYSV
jgi:hypothetical protein